MRCDAVCEQARLRESALTAGEQLKRMAPSRAKALSSSGPRQTLPTEAIRKSLCIFRLSKAEHHEVAITLAQGIRQWRRR